MIDVQGLKAEMARNDFTQKKMAEKLGMSQKTFSRKLKKGIFGTDEIAIMIQELNIADPASIFLPKSQLSKIQPSRSKSIFITLP